MFQTMIIIFFIKELSNEFKRKFECLEENTEKFKTFFISIQKKSTKLIKIV